MANKAPIHKIKVGNVTINVWEQEGKDFTTQSFQIQKNYLDKDEKWQSTNSFKATELQLVIAACQEAIRYKYLKDDAEPKI